MARSTVDSTLITGPRSAWDRAAGWLVPGLELKTPGANVTWLEYLIVRCMQTDDGIVEQPLGSNRGTRIDVKRQRAGYATPVPWCGIEVGDVYAKCGARIPRHYGAVDAWLPHITARALGGARPGWAVIYGVPGDGRHIGVLSARRDGVALTIEGNRGLAGSATNEGIGVFGGALSRRDVLGFVPPQPVPGWALDAYAPLWFLVEHWAALPPAVRRRATPRLAALIDGEAGTRSAARAPGDRT